MRKAVLAFLRGVDKQYVSGEQISQALQVSRTAVWKQIQALRRQGYLIESQPRLGYRLVESTARLLPQEIYGRLATQVLGKDIRYHQEVDSTNNEAKKLAAAGAAEGTVVLAESQSGGKGRLARSWFTPEGKGIWLSLILRPQMNPYAAARFTLLAAVAVVRAIERVTGLRCGIKWPNDILFQGKKLVGILTEISAEMDAINYLVIGIGINVNIDTDAFPDALKGTATSLSAALNRPVERAALLCALLAELEDKYEQVLREGFDGVLMEWRSWSITLGEMVEITSNDTGYGGKAIDIDEDGALLVETTAGLRRVMAGDVSLRPQGAGA